MHPPIVALDTETATARGTPHLLEVAAVHVVAGEIVDQFESLVRPQVPIDADATAVHGITDDMVRDAPDTPAVLDRLSSWLASVDPDGPWIAAHNARFDAHVLAFEYTRAGLGFPPCKLVDTLSLSRRAFPDAPDHKLETLCQVLDIEAPVRHRALADAVSCWKVLEACVDRWTPPDPEVASSWLAIAGSRGAALSLDSAAPVPPRMSPRLRPLEAACRAKTRVTLYYGDEGALSRLEVAPRFLFRHDKKDYLEAECARSGLLKTYRLDRVRQVRTNA